MRPDAPAFVATVILNQRGLIGVFQQAAPAITVGPRMLVGRGSRKDASHTEADPMREDEV